MTLHGRDFITMMEFTPKELHAILNKARMLKSARTKFSGVLHGKQLFMIFQKPSTRTRISFEAAVNALGGKTIALGWNEMQLGRGETLSDTARTISKYVDGVIARVLKHDDLSTLAESAAIPVINALSDEYHPCQALSDMLTLQEKKGGLDSLTLAWVGDGNNVCNSLIIASGLLGLNMHIASPKAYGPKPEAVAFARNAGLESGVKVMLTEEPKKAVKGADVVYTDTFVSMGHESESERRMRLFFPKYQVTPALLKHAKRDAVFMHCLPAHRGEEVTGEVIDGKNSIVWDQAENRVHLQKGLLACLL